MEEQPETSNQLENGGKVANWKRKGKLTELDRLKKRQKELQIMKMSQEWDARRQKRRMDRIQWLQQRKNHTSPPGPVSEITAKSVDDPSNEFDPNVVLAKANTAPVSPDSGAARLISNEGFREIEETSLENNDLELEEEPLGKRKHYNEERPFTYEESQCTVCETNQEYKSVVVKTERQDSDRFCNSNESKQALPSNSKNSTYRMVYEPSKKRRKESNQEFFSRTPENQYSHLSNQTNESNQGSPYHRLVTMVNTQPPANEDRFLNTSANLPGVGERLSNSSGHSPEIGDMFSNTSVIVQAMKQSGLDKGDLDEASLLMASEPVRLEDVLRKGGTNIQRLETRSVDLLSKQLPGKTQEKMDRTSIPRTRSRDSSVDHQKKTRKVENDPKNQAYPKIKQCYSLIGQENKISRTSPLSSPTSAGSPVATIASYSPESFTDKNEGRLQPVAQSPSTSSQSCPPSGYLVPIYKPSADEVVYAFVPNSGDRSLTRVSDPPGKVRTDVCCYTEADPRCTEQLGFTSSRAPTTTIHHGRDLDHLPRVDHALKVTESHHPTTVTWVNTPIASIGEKREFSNKTPVSGITVKSSAHEQIFTSGNPQRRNEKHSHREIELITKKRHNPSPVVTMGNGYTHVKTTHAPQPTNKSQVIRSTNLDSPSNDSINNPTAIYVRPKLVPREIVVPHHTGSGNVPIVEYIKTDAICDKDLGSWTAKNVADFIAATDCSESAKIFIEQDIDGKAVVLLSQNIFVNRLNLKLGTAIKLYNHIANLRTALLM